ncbi:sugar phosphate isomerase/epimerase [Nakamurella flavida]|uniref:Sugar phosphate isomerase/epimerase n=1 Tax=Nakamurella flavida TaxID=363630 RepID=A0A939C4X5_9ACTN|nr:sugar phosphate isomerase/epimerase family protein [Nakamurella flavida]MBM9475652.1 sugar phosphate isomerase/epimerase [Nakamurella flavida]MDP9778072.1 sugar phosphate isomerase/epimerase [Nakamurella flavida]
MATTGPTTALNNENWPIAAAMISYAGALPDGSSPQDQSAQGWAETVQDVVDAGFTEIDPTDSWLRIADLSPERLTEFQDVIAAAGLTIPAVSTARRSVVDPEFGDEYLAYGHRVIDASATVGASVVSFGFFRALTPEQKRALWFWTVQGPIDDPDPEVWNLAVRRTRELGEHAAQVGLGITLEMYEDTYLGTADSSARFVQDVGLDNVGLNPDLGNLVRLHRPVEHWEVMAEKTLPYANYWHVKNYTRDEDESTGLITTAPVPMEYGVINYRKAVKMAIALGYRGAFCTEHYGGDGLSVSATNREYLRRILPKQPVQI